MTCIEKHEEAWHVLCPMTMPAAVSLATEGRACVSSSGTGTARFHLGAVSVADSSALAVMLDWCRHAANHQSRIEFIKVPTAILSLAKLYHLEQILPVTVD